jgi:hypothetical protein
MLNVIAGFKYFLELSPPGRRINVFPDDVFLVSYPKSGNTWLRFLLANLIHPEKNPDFTNLNHLLPDLGGGRKRDFERMRRPRIMKSQEYFDHRYPRIIYWARDPRDVVLAEYYFEMGYLVDSSHSNRLWFSLVPCTTHDAFVGFGRDTDSLLKQTIEQLAPRT